MDDGAEVCLTAAIRRSLFAGASALGDALTMQGFCEPNEKWNRFPRRPAQQSLAQRFNVGKGRKGDYGVGFEPTARVLGCVIALSS